MSSRVFLYNSLGGGGRLFRINWLPNDLSAEGASSLGGPGVCPLDNFEN